MIREALLSALAVMCLAGFAAACEGQTGKVLYEDTFEDDSGGWGIDNNYEKIKNNTLIFRPNVGAKDNNTMRWSWLPMFSLVDADYCAEFVLPPAPAANNQAALGVVFWVTDSSNFYNFQIFTNKSIGLFRLSNAKWTTIYLESNSKSVNIDKNAVNTLRVVAKEGKLSLYINGALFKAIRAQTPEGETHFGLWTQVDRPTDADTSAVVKNFKVTSVDGAAISGAGTAIGPPVLRKP